MAKTLCLDFGNTRLKAGFFNGDELKETFILKDNVTQELEQLLKKIQPDHSILSSVINHPTETEALLSSKTRFHKLSNHSKLPFTIPVQTDWQLRRPLCICFQIKIIWRSVWAPALRIISSILLTSF
jgi:pantothenate kinase type III